MFFDSKTRKRISIASLLVTNLGVLIAVLIGKVSVAHVFLLYWAESAVIGIFTVLKLLTVHTTSITGATGVFGRLFFACFFCVHFGGFMAVHLVFLGMFLQLSDGSGFPERAVVQATIGGVVWGLVALFLSHGISFVVHFLIGRERRRVSAGSIFFQPYKRIVLMHVSILAGGFAVAALGSPTILLGLLVAGKTILDVRAHIKEHSNESAAPTPSTVHGTDAA